MSKAFAISVVLNPSVLGQDSYDAESGIPSQYLPIQNQARCGSCWSFSATEMLSARILRRGDPTTFESWSATVSPQIPVSFPEFSDGDGCNGGWPYKVGNMIISKQGLPDVDCAPYLSSSCEEGHDPSHDGCKPETWGQCWGSQTSWNHWGYYKDNYVVSVKQLQGEADYKADIMQNGDLSVAFNFFAEFNSYQGGVMTYATPDQGGHAVLISAWGNDNGTPYWKIRNSWGANWGEQGYCRMIRGNNFQNIENTGASFVLGSQLQDSNLTATFVPPLGAAKPGAWVHRSVGDEPVDAAFQALKDDSGERDIEILGARSQVVQGMHVHLFVRAGSKHLEVLAHRPPMYLGEDALPGFKIVHTKEIKEEIVV